jgi:hypothetical protein
MSLLEAMAPGVPVIASPVGGIRSGGRRVTGFLVAPGDTRKRAAQGARRPGARRRASAPLAPVGAPVLFARARGAAARGRASVGMPRLAALQAQPAFAA